MPLRQTKKHLSPVAPVFSTTTSSQLSSNLNITYHCTFLLFSSMKCSCSASTSQSANSPISHRTTYIHSCSLGCQDRRKRKEKSTIMSVNQEGRGRGDSPGMATPKPLTPCALAKILISQRGGARRSEGGRWTEGSIPRVVEEIESSRPGVQLCSALFAFSQNGDRPENQAHSGFLHAILALHLVKYQSNARNIKYVLLLNS